MRTTTCKHIIFFFCALFLAFIYVEPGSAQESADAKKIRIWKVKIEGNSTFEDIVIKKFIANKSPSFWQKLTFSKRGGFELSETEIRKDVIRIERFYQRRGFVDVKVSYRLEAQRKEWKKALIFSVQENVSVRISEVFVSISASKRDSAFIAEDEDFQRTIRRLPYREGRRFEPIEEAEVLGKLTQTLRSLGYAYTASRIISSVDTTKKEARITILNNPGPRTRFDSVFVEGETTLPDRYIVRETDIKRGELYSEAKIRTAQREVFNHQLMRLSLVSIPDQPKDTTLNILLRVKELPLRSFQLKFGAGNFDRLNELLRWNNFWQLFRGQATWLYRNVRGKGEQFSTSLTGSYYEQRLSMKYLFPYVYNTKSSVTINPFFEKRDETAYSITSGGLINSFGYQYSQNMTGTFSYEFAINNETVPDRESISVVEEVLPDSILAYNISSFSFNLYYTKGLVRGKKGLIIQPFLELSGLFGETSFSFQKVSLDIRKYAELNSNLVVAARVQGGAIYNPKQDSLPSDIRFFTGGTNTVRGWGRQDLGPKRLVTVNEGTTENPDIKQRYIPIGGNALFNFNIELRQQLNQFIKGFGVAAFLDGGQVWRGVSNINSSDIQYGIGGGVRYQSPIGPIRVDIGYKVNPTDEDLNIIEGAGKGSVWDRWGLHFSIGQAF